MNTPEQFEPQDGYVSYRPVKVVTFQEAVALGCDAIALAREQQIKRLLIDTTGLTGFASPKTLDRYQMAEQFARAGQSSVKVAIVARFELIDRDKFGVTVARNRGLMANVFPTEAEALAWLLDPNAD